MARPRLGREVVCYTVCHRSQRGHRVVDYDLVTGCSSAHYVLRKCARPTRVPGGLVASLKGGFTMPPPKKVDERWYLIAAILVVTLVVVVVVELFD